MLIALRSRCKGSRLKTFQNIYRQEIRAGNVEADPASVYERIKSKHLLFSESVEEREIRVDSEHAALLKGKLTGHQFEPLFERSIAELEEIGLGKTPRELFLSYLRKVGPVLQKEIRKDKRIWPKETELRAPRSWEEAHKVVLEYEQRESTNRAQVSSVYVAEETPRPRRQPKGGEDSVLNTDTGKGAGRKSKTMGTVLREISVSTPMTKSCVRRLLRSSVLAETVLGPRLTVVAKAVRDEAVERETARAEIALQAVEGLDVTVLGGEQTRQTGEETEAEVEETNKVFCVLTSWRVGPVRRGVDVIWSTPLWLRKTSRIPRVRERLLQAPLRLPCRRQPKQRLNLHFWGWRQRPCLARLAFWLKKFCRRGWLMSPCWRQELFRLQRRGLRKERWMLTVP